MPLPITYCTLDGCDKKNFGHGMCSKHYARWRKYGSPEIVKVIIGDPVRSFWKKVDKSKDCWIWTANTDPAGYGRFWLNGKLTSAHRTSYEMAFGDIPAGMDIDHQCHTPACVNPKHLKAVTRKGNAENRSGADIRSRSGIRGVSYNSAQKYWYATVKHHGKNHHIRKFRTRAQAERAAIQKRLELFDNSVMDFEVPESILAIGRWHEQSHPFKWARCVYEPCNLMHPEFREAWAGQ